MLSSKLSRRALVAGGSLAGFGLVCWRCVYAAPRRVSSSSGLEPDSGRLLDLPEGFEYEVLERVGQPMDDGYRVPARPDGMACFELEDGTLALLRNHENGGDPDEGPYSSGQRAPVEAYNPRAMGGVSRLVVDPVSFERRSSNLVLAGTLRNCAGGTSPWGWLTCEETVEPNHGYVFACSPSATSVAAPVRIPNYGRCRHEAATVDPDSLIAYLTEDQGDGCFYRFVPESSDQPFEGTLFALSIPGNPNRDLSEGLTVGDQLDVGWVPIGDPDPQDDSLRLQGHRAGAAIFRRNEGIWLHEGEVYFSSTSGGPDGAGQIFKLDIDEQRLTLMAQADGENLEGPDNITMAPFGDLYIAEDSWGDQYLRVLKPDGSLHNFARNASSGGELAGVCFSPNADAMFVNMQIEGITLVVTGPFQDWRGNV